MLKLISTKQKLNDLEKENIRLKYKNKKLENQIKLYEKRLKIAESQDNQQWKKAVEVRQNKYLERMEEYKNKINHLINKDPEISIPKIATALGIQRQTIYKNENLRNYIDFMKSLKKEAI